MKLSILTSDLKTAVSGLSKVISTKANLPILSHVRLEADGKAVLLTGTDFNQVATYEIKCDAPLTAPVSTLIPFDAIQTALKAAQGTEIEIETGKDAATISYTVAGQSIGRRVETLDIADWPSLPNPVEAKPVETGFLTKFRRAATFASTDDSRPLLKAVFMDVDAKSGHRLVATDSRRLSVFPCGVMPLKESVIVPVARFLGWTRLEGETRIGAGKGVFTLVCGKWSYTTKVVEGQYPRWSQVVPARDGDRTLELSEADAAMLIKALPGLPAYDNSHEAVVLHMDGNAVRVFSRQDSRSPESAIRLDSSKHEGKDAFSIGLNRDYFRDALQAGFRFWEFQDAVSPLLGRQTKDDKASIHILMPIRTVDHEVQRAEAPVPTASPVPKPIQTQEAKETPMPKKIEVAAAATAEAPTSLDRILAAYEAARNAVREANNALVEVAASVREAIKDDRARRKEIADVRAGLARLQAIRV